MQLEILVDPLAVFMALVVSGVSFLIHVYSVAYMDGDRGYARYFSYLNFFVFSMLLLVLAGNFVILIVGWAFVGFASYALISFWYRRRTATYAGMKAFVINVVGDVGLVLAAILLQRDTGALDYPRRVRGARREVYSQNEWVIVAVCLLILVGAFAKSAQIPLHTWLPDAMEGPTPVSALIHAATMVTAGVYLIARMHPLFELAPTAADISAAIGALTLVFAASVALVVTDLKRIIAYSTISQIGYMIMGVSIAAYGAGHVPPDDARLLQGADVHGGRLGDRRDGGRRRTSTACRACGARCRSRSWRSWSRRSRWPRSRASRATSPRTRSSRSRPSAAAATGSCTSPGTLAALMTAFYAFRMVFRVFGGEPNEEARELERGHLHHAEPVNPMTGEPEDTDVGYPGPGAPHRRARDRRWRSPMAILAVLVDLRGRAPDPRRHARDRELPRPDVRGLALRRHRRLGRASRRWR